MPLIALGPNGFQLATLLVIGLLAGVLGGMLGIGGGLVMIPAMLLLIGENAYGPDSLHLYKLAALVSAVLLSITALRQHVRAGAIQPRVLEGAVPAGFVGVALGVLLARLLSGDLTHVLRRIFGAFMILAVLLSIWMRRTARTPEDAAPQPAPRAGWRLRAAAVVGLPAGVVSGLLGVGGGVWAVPAQHALMGIGLRSAIANSAGLVLAQTAAATVGMTLTVANIPALRVGDGLWLTLFLVPGALAGGGAGAALVHRLPVGAVRGVFYVVLVAAGLRLALG